MIYINNKVKHSHLLSIIVIITIVFDYFIFYAC
jgi:hypothetical protein